MTTVTSLTRAEAETRARILTVSRYDIEIDLTGLLEGEVWESTSSITFGCTEPGASTFVDAVGDVRRATLNGVDLDLTSAAGGRVPLPDLARENTLVIELSQPDTAGSAGILRTVDPTDGLVYVWTSLECDDARRLWGCFDQPDLKALHRFTVTAPAAWTVTSNMRPEDVTDDAGSRTWSFPDTPPLSPYVTVVNAGPFHEVREQRGDYSLGLYCRQSLVPNLERDASSLLDLTEAGLAFFGDRFGRPFPEAHYDQVFVPNMGGAMENWGCVTWGDGYLHRGTPTHSQRHMVAVTLLHEMAHMWFGDLVTMRWWDDLWLNEAFASWASTWAAAEATEFTDAWAGFLIGRKLDAYRVDMGPATHPIRHEVPDVDSALANFDAITYAKGQAVLHQLMAYVGEEAFTRGLQDYFSRHAWSNTRLDDLISAVERASGRDLRDWTSDWLDRAGTDTLTLTSSTIDAVAPDGGEPRPHRIDIGTYSASGELLERTPVETSGGSTPLPSLPDGLHLLNDTDLAFAAVRTHDDSLRRLLVAVGSMPDPTARALMVATGMDLLRKGELGGTELLGGLLGALGAEKSATLLEPFLLLARDVAELWCPPDQVATSVARVADQALALSRDLEQRRPALNVLAACASTTAHDDALDQAMGDDVDLAWRVMIRRAERGVLADGVVEDLIARDPDPDARARAVAVNAARPEEAAKAEAWHELFEKRSVPAGYPTFHVAKAFWRPAQVDLLLPWADRYLEEMRNISGGLLAILSMVRSMYPIVGDDDFVTRSLELADAPGTDPTVRSALLTGADTLSRMIRARAAG
ncbi:aminopeptidase N [Nocardioides sp.]|uniref:aminopeptidase N n=1 Tax=Nocardioides sp. TaxID=35761 RepID=UPI002ED5EF57